MSEAREQDERAAQRIESELVAATDELERRVHRWTDVKARVRPYVRPAVIGGIVVASLLGGLFVYRFMTREERRRKETRKAFIRVRRHPERLATRAKEEPLPMNLGKKVLGAAVGAFATQAARRAAQRMMPA